MSQSLDLAAFHRLVACQHGLVTREQARALGLTESAITRRVARGEWIRLAPGVYLRAGTRVQLAIDDTRRQKLVEWPGLYETLVLHSRRGRNGCGPFRAILDVRYGERGVPDSDFERMVQSLLLDAGMPEPVLQVEVFAVDGVFIARVDLAYPQWKIAIELDGRGHITDEAFERDPVRRNRLELASWLVLDFTWRYYVEQPRRLIGDVAEAIALRRVRRG